MALTEMHCGKCGIEFAVPTHFYNECKKEGGRQTWYCPNGHPRVFSSEMDKLRQERDLLKQSLAQKDDEIKRQRDLVIAGKAQVTKLKKRASAGVCPCCNRTFSNMARHMAHQHPEFDSKVVEFAQKARA